MFPFRTLLFCLLLIAIPFNPALSKDKQQQETNQPTELEQLRKEAAELRAIVKKLALEQVNN